MQNKRRKIWIDRFQTLLSLRIALYFVLYQVMVWVVVFMARDLTVAFSVVVGPAAAPATYFVLIGCVVIVGLLFIYDAIVLSHRVVGPLVRIRKTLKAVAASEEVELISLRKGDFLQELKDELNAMLQALEQRGAVVLKAKKSRQHQPVTV